jgi:hypothetical protein
MKIKNENQDLLDLKIEIIDNGNTKTFQEIALLIDKPEYLRLIDKIREEYNLYKPELTDGAEFTDILLSFSSGRVETKSINLSKYKSLERFKELLPKEFNNVMTFVKDNDDGMLLAQAEAVLLCFEFGRPYYFVPIVLQSIMCRDVDSRYLQRTKAVVRDQDYVLHRFDEIDIPQVAIEMSPYSTYTDIKKAIRDSKNIFKTDPRFKYFGKKPDYHEEIRKYRCWYWEHLAGKSYPTIADEWMENPLAGTNDSGSDENVVLKGIQTYKKLLEI